jgi:hypothetical protein
MGPSRPVPRPSGGMSNATGLYLWYKPELTPSKQARFGMGRSMLNLTFWDAVDIITYIDLR